MALVGRGATLTHDDTRATPGAGQAVKAGRLLLPVIAAAYGTRTLRLPLRGWDLTGEGQGVGPVTRRLYWIDIDDPRRPAAQVVETVLQRLPSVMPAALARFRRVRRGGPTVVGDRFRIQMLGVRRARVQVVDSTASHFRLQTLRQHSESGWIEFSSEAREGGGYRLCVVSQVRASSWFDRCAYLLGAGILQRLTWEIGLRRALRLSGGRQAGHGTTTVEWP